MPLHGEVVVACSAIARRLPLPLTLPSTQMPRVCISCLFLIWVPATKSHMKTGVKFHDQLTQQYQILRNIAQIAATLDNYDVLVRKRV